tara:strand:+ start:160 stop:972 length:813 start_codon:yes stop_codon:yes gene_type:complete
MIDKKAKYDVQGGIRNYLGKQKTVSDVPLKWKSGPSHPETELAYITKAEKKLLIKKDLHKSLKDGPNKGPGGIMSLNNDGIGDLGGPGNVGPGGGFGDTGDFGSEKANDANLAAGNKSVGYGGGDGDPRTGGGVTTGGFFGGIVDTVKDYIKGGGLIGAGIRGITGLVNQFTGPKATEYGNLGIPGYNMLNIAGPVSRPPAREGGDGENKNLYATTNQYTIPTAVEEEGITTLVNNPDFIQRFRVKNPYRQDKQGQLDPQILEMINNLYT